jgi:hypothetical protein
MNLDLTDAEAEALTQELASIIKSAAILCLPGNAHSELFSTSSDPGRFALRFRP